MRWPFRLRLIIVEDGAGERRLKVGDGVSFGLALDWSEAYDWLAATEAKLIRWGVVTAEPVVEVLVLDEMRARGEVGGRVGPTVWS